MIVLDQFDSEHPCSYLDRTSLNETLVLAELAGEEYLDLLGRFYRRAGRTLYRPICVGCRECVPLRVLVQEFQPTRSQARCWRKNQDLQVRIGTPQILPPRLQMYNDYLRAKHPEPDAQPRDLLEYFSFLIDSPLPTLEFQYRLGKRLIGIGIVDDLGTAASSVYFYYDPAESSRSLGVYSMLYELEWARQRGYQHHYLGYWVQPCKAMAYKSLYQPAEILLTEGQWSRMTPSASLASDA